MSNRIMAGKHNEVDTDRLIDGLMSRQERMMDVNVNLHNTSMNEDGRTITATTEQGFKAIALNKTALDQTLRLYEEKTEKELPVETFLQVLSPAERQSVWNREIKQLGLNRTIRTLIPRNRDTRELMPQETLQGFANVSMRYKPMDNGQVIPTIIRASEVPVVAVTGSIIDTDHSKFRFIPQFSDRVSVGEFCPGFEVVNSESGQGALEFFAFVYRKICSNGMMVEVSGSSTRKIHLGTIGKDIVLPDFGAIWGQAIEQCKAHHLAASTYARADQKVRVINFAKDQGLTHSMIESITETANEFYNGGRTVADITGAITHAAQRYRSEDTRKRTDMELFAGKALNLLMAA